MTTSVSGSARSAGQGRLRLLADKLEMPGLGLAVVDRPRVAALMDRATSHRVALVTGPAGAGKTVACVSWVVARTATAAARQRDRAAAWLTLDPADREPARFWAYLAAALAGAGAISLDDADRLATEGPHGSGHEIARDLLSALEQAAVPVTVVLDDVHQLAGSDVVAGLDELIHHAPESLGLVLAGRYVPGLALAKLRVSGQVGDVGPAELACTGEEAGAYLASMGVTVTDETRAGIMRQTEGWMAGLRLLSMTMSPTGQPAPETDQLVSDYLCDEVLAQLPPGTRDLMLRTCLTEEVPADLARELTQDPAAAARIDQLGKENGLISPAGTGQAGYRYHPMLRTALDTVLRRDRPTEVPGLLGRIARWHAGRDDVLSAVRAAARAGDWEFGAELLRRAGPVVPSEADWAGLEEVLASFPPDRRSADAALAAELAAARLWQNDPDGALPHLDCAQGALAGLADPDRATAELWVTALQVMRQAPGETDLAGPWQLASRAHEESRSVPEHRATGLLWLALGCASLRRLDPRQASAALQHASSQLAAGGLALIRERARSWEAVAHACYGDLATATRVAAEVAEGPAGGPELAPILAISQAFAHIARDEPEAAAMLLDQADQAAVGPQPAGEPVLGVLTELARTRIAINDGNLTGARGLVRLLTEMTAGDGAAAAAISVLDAEISLAAGERDRARAVLAGMADSGPAAYTVAQPRGAICQARLLMAEDDDKGALKLLEPVMSSPPDASTGLDVRLTALLTSVVAHRRLSQASEAAERLEEALALAEPDDQSGAFIAAGSPIRSALTILITPASPCAGFAGRILDRFDGRLPHGITSPSGAVLTESELAVLRFLPSHMTNQEIAESLFLSINTIKTHLSSAYRKLGVTSRRQAIAQGRRLDLL